ncbi:hypothetical protein E2320_000132 [Naja naja]|nr:hypothetical protein E2320_000132 [Naja naja]
MQSSDFEKNIIFIFPRVENVENPLSIRIWALPEELTQGISQNVGVENVENPLYFWIWALPEELAQVNWWKMLKIHIIFRSELSLRSYPKAYLKMLEIITFDTELGFRKKLIFMLPRVENVENPLYFRIWALPEELAPVNWWKMLKIHIIFRSELSLRS